ncbi:MAG: hypothetical protein RLZZ297_654 [Chloroflexota bacterium]
MLFDTNVWIALLLTTHPNHARARGYYVGLDEHAVVLLAQSVRISVLRLLTTPTLQRSYGTGPISNTTAHQIVESLVRAPRVRSLSEPADLFESWSDLVGHSLPDPQRWMDVYLCALARHAGVPLVTFDRALAAFRDHGVDVVVL